MEAELTDEMQEFLRKKREEDRSSGFRMAWIYTLLAVAVALYAVFIWPLLTARDRLQRSRHPAQCLCSECRGHAR